jgi:hypothetical protein
MVTRPVAWFVVNGTAFAAPSGSVLVALSPVSDRRSALLVVPIRAPPPIRAKKEWNRPTATDADKPGRLLWRDACASFMPARLFTFSGHFPWK